jgi:hypothetical protein
LSIDDLRVFLSTHERTLVPTIRRLIDAFIERVADLFSVIPLDQRIALVVLVRKVNASEFRRALLNFINRSVS